MQRYNLRGKCEPDVYRQIAALVQAVEGMNGGPSVVNPMSGFSPQQEQFIKGLIGPFGQAPIGTTTADPLVQDISSSANTVTSVTSISTSSGLSLVTTGTTMPLITLSGTPTNMSAANISTGVLPTARGGTGTGTPTGTYAPTLTNVLNLDSSTAYPCQWMQVGDMVVVSGKVDADPTAAGQVQLGISLPVASNIGSDEDLAGTAFSSTVAGLGAAIGGDAANNRALMVWIAVSITNNPMYFSFMYQVI